MDYRPIGYSLGSQAIGVDKATGRQILRAPDGGTRLGSKPLRRYSEDQFRSAFAGDPLTAYWMIALGGPPAHQTAMDVTGMTQGALNQFINQHAPGVGQTMGHDGWVSTGRYPNPDPSVFEKPAQP